MRNLKNRTQNIVTKFFSIIFTIIFGLYRRPIFQPYLMLTLIPSFDIKKKKKNHIQKKIMEAFGLPVHVYKFTFSAFFFFFFSHLLTLGDNFYCYEQCIHCSHIVHTLFTY